MALEDRLELLAAAVGDDVQALRIAIGNLTTLNTTQKTNLVGAINEVLGAIADGGGASINDAVTNTASVWSSSKTNAAIAEAIANFVDGAPAALDTWQELVAALEGQDTAVGGLVEALSNRVRFDAPQTLTAGQQLQACQNIGVGDPEVDLVAAYTAARDSA